MQIDFAPQLCYHRTTKEAVRVAKTIAQVIGYIAVAENLLIYLSNRRERILLWKFVSDTLWLLNYLLMGGFTGAALNGVAMVREGVFALRGKYRWADAKWVPALFLSLTWVSPALEWINSGAFSWTPLLPALGSMIFVLGFYAKSTVFTKASSLVGNVLWLTYAILIGNIAGLVGNVLMLISALVGLWRERRAKQG